MEQTGLPGADIVHGAPFDEETIATLRERIGNEIEGIQVNQLDLATLMTYAALFEEVRLKGNVASIVEESGHLTIRTKQELFRFGELALKTSVGQIPIVREAVHVVNAQSHEPGVNPRDNRLREKAEYTMYLAAQMVRDRVIGNNPMVSNG